MKDTFYFTHDYNARSDEKIKLMIRKLGIISYGIYWAIIEDLYNNANALRLDCEGIAYELRTSDDIVKSIIHDFDLFVFDGDFFGSLSVQRRLDERNQKSIKARESAFRRWSDTRKDANALQTQSEGNAIKEKKGNETKRNETKGEEIKENTKINSDITAYEFLIQNCSIQLEQLWMKNSKLLTDKERIIEHFNNKVDIEKLEHADKVLIARLKQVLMNWGSNSKTSTTGLKPINQLTENELMGMPFHKMQEYGQAGIDEIQALKREIYKRNGYN